jgi:hypothetical protein
MTRHYDEGSGGTPMVEERSRVSEDLLVRSDGLMRRADRTSTCNTSLLA